MSHLDTAIRAAKEGGQVLLSFYEQGFTTRRKPDGSDITEADTASEQAILAALSPHAHPVLSEETRADASLLGEPRVWIVDPLDGTSDFARRTDEFGVHIALCEEGTPVLGVVYQPRTDTLYFAERGGGAYRQQGARTPEKIAASTVSELTQARLGISRMHQSPQTHAVLQALGVSRVVPRGGAGGKLCAVAEGALDLYVSASRRICVWDTCAPTLILQEAGGTVTDLHGNPLRYNDSLTHPQGVLASNGLLLQPAVAAIKTTLAESGR